MSPTDPDVTLSMVHETSGYPHGCPECRRMVATSNRCDWASAAQDHYQQKAREREEGGQGEGVSSGGHV